MKYLFGKEISYSWTPVKDGEPISIFAITAARLYSAEPSNDQLLDTDGSETTNLVESVTSGFGSATDNQWLLPFSAITDPTPYDNSRYEHYYAVVNFTYDDGGATQFTNERIFIYRPDAVGSRMSVSSSDVLALEGKIGDIKPSSFIDNHAALAIKKIKRRLAGLGLEQRQLVDPEELNDAALYLTTAYCCKDLAGGSNEFWWQKYESYLEDYNEVFAATDVNIDADDDNRPEEDETRVGGMVRLL